MDYNEFNLNPLATVTYITFNFRFVYNDQSKYKN